MTGPLSTQALASRTFGLYSGFVYFTPLLGGLIADRWIGQRNGVVIGSMLMSGGPHRGPLRHGGEQRLRFYCSLEREAAERLGPNNPREFLAVVDLLEKELLPPQQ